MAVCQFDTRETRAADDAFLTAVLKAAKSDMRRARKEGEIYIAQTTVGAVHLSYNAQTEQYTWTYNSPSNLLYKVLTFTAYADSTLTNLSRLYRVVAA